MIVPSPKSAIFKTAAPVDDLNKKLSGFKSLFQCAMSVAARHTVKGQ